MINRKLILGTASFASGYGIKKNKDLSVKKINKIYNVLRNRRIDSIDTAFFYSGVEKKIGQSKIKNLKIYTKIPKIPSNFLLDPENWILNKVKKSLLQSKQNLSSRVRCLSIPSAGSFDPHRCCLSRNCWLESSHSQEAMPPAPARAPACGGRQGSGRDLGAVAGRPPAPAPGVLLAPSIIGEGGSLASTAVMFCQECRKFTIASACPERFMETKF